MYTPKIPASAWDRRDDSSRTSSTPNRPATPAGIRGLLGASVLAAASSLAGCATGYGEQHGRNTSSYDVNSPEELRSGLVVNSPEEQASVDDVARIVMADWGRPGRMNDILHDIEGNLYERFGNDPESRGIGHQIHAIRSGLYRLGGNLSLINLQRATVYARTIDGAVREIENAPESAHAALTTVLDDAVTQNTITADEGMRVAMNLLPGNVQELRNTFLNPVLVNELMREQVALPECSQNELLLLAQYIEHVTQGSRSPYNDYPTNTEEIATTGRIPLPLLQALHGEVGGMGSLSMIALHDIYHSDYETRMSREAFDKLSFHLSMKLYRALVDYHQHSHAAHTQTTPDRYGQRLTTTTSPQDTFTVPLNLEPVQVRDTRESNHHGHHSHGHHRRHQQP